MSTAYSSPCSRGEKSRELGNLVPRKNFGFEHFAEKNLGLKKIKRKFGREKEKGNKRKEKVSAINDVIKTICFNFQRKIPFKNERKFLIKWKKIFLKVKDHFLLVSKKIFSKDKGNFLQYLLKIFFENPRTFSARIKARFFFKS